MATAGDRLDDPVTPTAERLYFLIDPDEPTYTGKASIDLTIAEKLERFEIHGEELDIISGSLVQGRKATPVTTEEAEGGRIAVIPSKPVAPGDYTLELDFENDVNEQAYGLYKFEVGGQVFWVSQFQADDARTAFPCFDEPSFKIPYQVTVEAPERMVVVTNMPEATSTVDGGWRVVEFAVSQPMPSYLLALAVGPYVATPIEGMKVPGNIYTVPGAEDLTGFLAGEVPRSLAWLETYFGTPYPYPKLDFIVIPEYSFGAMENPGAVVARTELALLDPASATPSRKVTIAWVMAHELAHMWFGDLVTMKWWDDFWLNESFAEWVSRKAIRDLWADYAPAFRDVDLAQRVLGQDGLPSTRPVRVEVDPTAVFESMGPLATDKGALVLAMVEAWVGADKFQAGVRSYLSAHSWGNAGTADLFSALREATGQDVEAVLTGFLDQPGAPLIRLAIGADGAVTLTQTRYLVYGAEAATSPTWKVPMTLKYADASGVHTHSLLLAGAEQEVDLGESAPAWVFPAAEGVGYFVWSESPEAIGALVDASGEHLSPLERGALLADLALLRDNGEVKGGDLLRLLLKFEGETEPSVVERLLAHLRFLDEIVPEEAEEEAGEGEEAAEDEKAGEAEDEGEEPVDPEAAYVGALARPALDHIGLQPSPDEPPTVTELRPKLLFVLGDMGEDEEVLAWADTAAASFLEDPGSVPASLARVALFLHAEKADTAFQDKLIALWRESADPQLKDLCLNAIGRVKTPEGREKALAFALSEEVGFADTVTIVMSAFHDEEDKDAGLEWAMAHNDEITSRLPPFWVPFLVEFGDGCSEARFQKAKAFYGDPARAVTGTQQHVTQVGEEVAACVAQKKLHGPSVVAFLEAYAKEIEAAREAEEKPKKGK